MPLPSAPDRFEERWKPRRRVIALFGITTTLVLWLGNACRPCYIGVGAVGTSRSFVGTTRDNIRIFEAKSSTEVYLTDRAGASFSPPCWTYQDEMLWYWSPEDRSLCGVDAMGKRRYIALPKEILPPKRPVVSLYRTAQGFLLNLLMPAQSHQQKLSETAGVLFVPIDDPKRAKILPGLRDARGNAAFKAFGGRNAKGGLILWADADGPTRTLNQNAADWVYWDFAPGTERFVFVDGDEAGVSDGERVLWTRGSGGAFSFCGVGFAPSGDVWVSEDGLAYTGGVAVLEAETGRLRGWRVKSVFPLSSPLYEADAKLIPLLRQLHDGR